ncbi:hypothetical protein BRSPCE3_62420 [Bradyrhizobium sp. Ce-3]|nr:hypothetical protein BRSPCE3_62420 [Bradyrhizobium sp. Ce-3]
MGFVSLYPSYTTGSPAFAGDDSMGGGESARGWQSDENVAYSWIP